MPLPSIRRSAVLLAATTCFAGCGDGGGAALPASIDIASVHHEVRTIIDPSRPTRANGSAPAAAARTLATRVWYPPTPLDAPACADSRCALVVLAHGFGGNTGRFDAIGRRLAAAGYVVAAPSFPLTNDGTPGGHLTGLNDVRQQPADLTAVIDALLAADADRGDPLFGRIDGGRIGALGHSLGGTTVSAASRSGCCVESRIAATVLVAPGFVLLPLLLDGAPTPDGPPVLVLNGSDDRIVLAEMSLDTTRTLTPPWYFVEIPGAAHSDLIENVGEPATPLDVSARAAVAFFDEFLGGKTGATGEALAALAAEGNGVEVAE